MRKMDKEIFDKATSLMTARNYVEIVAMMTEELCLVENEVEEFQVRMWRTNAFLRMLDDAQAVEDVRWMMDHIEVASKALKHFGQEDEKHLKEECYYILARDEHRHKKYDEAILYYNKVVELNPHLAVAYQGRGAAYYAKGDMAKAQEDLMDYLRENPKAAEQLNGNFEADGKEGCH